MVFCDVTDMTYQPGLTHLNYPDDSRSEASSFSSSLMIAAASFVFVFQTIYPAQKSTKSVSKLVYYID